MQAKSKSFPAADIILQSLRDYGAIILCKNIDQAVELANELAPEHLEVCTENPMEYIGRLDNAGSVFLGAYAPEPARRLLRRTEPCVAYKRNRALFFAVVGG